MLVLYDNNFNLIFFYHLNHVSNDLYIDSKTSIGLARNRKAFKQLKLQRHPKITKIVNK